MNDRLGLYFSELGALPLSAQVTGLDGRSTALDDFFADAIERIRATHAAGNTVIFIGNGGSAAIASHMAIDYTKNGGIRAVAMNDGAALTCLSNDLGYENVFAKQLEMHAREGSRLGGHPETKVPGVEASTGALGHGLAIGVGMALAARLDARDSRVFVVLGDGETNEGSVWELAMSAAKHKLANLVAIVDYNKLQSYGPTSEVLELEPLADKWRSFGFAVAEVDGHDVDGLRGTFASLPLDAEKPSAVICHTVKGKGIPFIENDARWHHKSKLGAEEIAALFGALE